MVALAVTFAAVAIWVTTIWLLKEADRAPDPQRAQLRIEAIKTGLTVGVGAGGAFVLLLAARRQWLNERAQAHLEATAQITQHDATERRITDLYGGAVSQLGSERAPARIGALYALERLAQTYPSYRQTVVDVICAYLRVDFEEIQTGAAAHGPEQRAAPEPSSPATNGELQVRVVAQRILITHLREDRERDDRGGEIDQHDHWSGIRVDLTGATLSEWDWTGVAPSVAIFDRARFLNGANFAHARFKTDVWLRDVRFELYANFYCVKFHRRAIFNGVRSEGKISLLRSQFYGMTFFSKIEASIDLNDAEAKVEFDGSWGRVREWPSGWRTTGPALLHEDGDWLRVTRRDTET